MIRPNCSYWINVKGPETARKAAKHAMMDHNIIPDLVEYTETDRGVDAYEVPGGSTEKFESLDEVMLAVAAECPEAEISVREVCEELWVPERELDYTGGMLIRTVTHVEKAVTTVPGQAPSPAYDPDTVNACVEFLRRKCFMDAADALQLAMPT